MLAETAAANAAQSNVTGAIRAAATQTGARFEYLLATAQIESSLNPNLKARTSSATGLFQFIDQTWLSTLKSAGPSLGYGKYADAIAKNSSGRYSVSDPTLRAQIMNLRKDPTANALMAGAFTQSNADRLNQRIGRAPNDGELYMAHFLGPGGAAKLITANSSNPNTAAATLFPRAASANHSIFYDKVGRARSVADVYQMLANKVARAQAPKTPPQPTATALLAPPLVITPSAAAPDAPAVRTVTPAAAPSAITPSASGTVTLAAATPAERPREHAFHDLFRTEGQTGVSAGISELWGTRAAASAQTPDLVTSFAPTDQPPVAPPAARNPTDFFRDLNRLPPPTVDRTS